jgi:hypothetical protein
VKNRAWQLDSGAIVHLDLPAFSAVRSSGRG